MIRIVLGGQFGSEGKGSVVSWLAQREDFDLVIRTGSPNAGHTFRDKQGDLHKMRQLPCTWAFQDAPLYVPAGAVVSQQVLDREMLEVFHGGFKGDVWVSPQAALIDRPAQELEDITQISSGTTHEGVGGARALKCLRKASLVGGMTVPYESGQREVYRLLHDPSSNILIEATQGFGLSMDSENYPFVTSTNLDTYRILSDAEVPFGVHHVETWMVLRTFPIRIAGNSGPLSGETSWADLQEKYGSHIPVEQTTVTKKTRRVGLFDVDLAKQAINRCGPEVLVLSFYDYLQRWDVQKAVDWLTSTEDQLGRTFDYLGVGIGELIRR
jgi:adenylosuccinate synthase